MAASSSSNNSSSAPGTPQYVRVQYECVIIILENTCLKRLWCAIFVVSVASYNYVLELIFTSLYLCRRALGPDNL